MPEQFYIIDGHSQIHRFFHSKNLYLTSSSGEPTTATFLFTKMLLKLIREKQPSYLAVAMDGPREQLLRREWDPTYKANRPPTEPDVIIQVRRIREILNALGVVALRSTGYEADDIIATLATQCVSDDVNVTIVTGDKDFGGLLADIRVRLFDPIKNEYIHYQKFCDVQGYSPHLVPSMLALMGDAADNIPTIKGFGPKTALHWLKEFGSIEQLVANRSELPERLFATLDEAVKSGRLQLNQRLVNLNTQVPLTFKHSDLSLVNFNVHNASHIFQELGFSRWSNDE